MAVLAQFPATAGQFVKDNTTDLVNLFLGWAVFWCYGFRVAFMCGYTSTQTVSRYYCDQFLNELFENNAGTECTEGTTNWDVCNELILRTPKFAQQFTVDLLETCTGRGSDTEAVAFTERGSLNPLGMFCSGMNGSGEFLVTLLLMILTTVVFFWKMAKFIHCPDKLERKRRKEVMLKDFLLSQNSVQ